MAQECSMDKASSGGRTQVGTDRGKSSQNLPDRVGRASHPFDRLIAPHEKRMEPAGVGREFEYNTQCQLWSFVRS